MTNRLFPAKAVVSFLVLLVASVGSSVADDQKRVIYEKNSLYQYFAVVEDSSRRERYLVTKKGDFQQGGISLDEPGRLLLEYTRLAFVGLALLEKDPQNVLFLGLGVGSMPRYLHKYFPEARITVAELDPDIVETAQKFFYFQDSPNLMVRNSDGRVFVKRAKERYDLIVLDAYQSDTIPFHLTTVEFLREVKSKLTPRGVVVANIAVLPWTVLYDAMLKTYSDVFPNVIVFAARGSANFIFTATAGDAAIDQEEALRRARGLDDSKSWDLDLTGSAQSRMLLTKERVNRGKILTDDFAPVNIYKHQAASGHRP